MIKHIRIGASVQQDSERAAQELCDQLDQEELGLVVFYCSPKHNLDAIASVLNARLPHQPVMGCTTAGEIGPDGYQEQSITGFSISAAICKAHFQQVEDLKNFTTDQGQIASERLLEAFEDDNLVCDSDHCFILSMIDGLSLREEPLVRAVYSVLQGIPLIGGSAGDGLSFGATYIYYNGIFHSDYGLFALIHISRPFKAFKAQHFVSTKERMVITGALPEKRIVTEINGLPAGEEYARLVGIAYDRLNPQAFAAHPVVVRIGGEEFVRSIQKANPDGSLSFFCAIDLGVVLTVAKGVDTIESLQKTMQQLHDTIGEPELIIGCDCVLRRLEFQEKGQLKDISKLLTDNHVIGFSTYGEQYYGMHVNQTLTGLAIAQAPDPSDPT